jgi:hypothetical protein
MTSDNILPKAQVNSIATRVRVAGSPKMRIEIFGALGLPMKVAMIKM